VVSSAFIRSERQLRDASSRLNLGAEEPSRAFQRFVEVSIDREIEEIGDIIRETLRNIAYRKVKTLRYAFSRSILKPTAERLRKLRRYAVCRYAGY